MICQQTERYLRVSYFYIRSNATPNTTAQLAHGHFEAQSQTSIVVNITAVIGFA